MKNVFVQGLGFVGSAMATAIALAKDPRGNLLYKVTGVDLPNKSGQKRVDQLNQGKFPFESSDKSLVDAVSIANKNGNLIATSKQDLYGKADIIVVDIPLDIDYLEDKPVLDFKNFKKAFKAVGEQVKKETLIIIETTVPPGTCENVVMPTLQLELKKRGMDSDSILVAHSYERVMPGDDYLSSIINFWRVYAGINNKSSKACQEFLESVINTKDYPLTRLSSITASETAKVLENTYRAVNIAFIDEWTKYAEYVGIDLFEVTDAIRKRPTHSNLRYPGLGVGGYCLTKDPALTPAAVEQIFKKKLDFPFSKLALLVNHQMPMHTINRLNSLMKGKLKDKRVLICGVSYRQEVADTRFSPCEPLAKELIKGKAKITCHDPYVRYWDEMEINVSRELPNSSNFDAVIMAVPHKEYKRIDLSSWAHKNLLILDANMVFTSKQRESAKKLGLRLESIGRASGL